MQVIFRRGNISRLLVYRVVRSLVFSKNLSQPFIPRIVRKALKNIKKIFKNVKVSKHVSVVVSAIGTVWYQLRSGIYPLPRYVTCNADCAQSKQGVISNYPRDVLCQMSHCALCAKGAPCQAYKQKAPIKGPFSLEHS